VAVIISVVFRLTNRSDLSVGAWFILGMLCLLIASYMAWRDEHKTVIELTNRLAEIENAKPILKWADNPFRTDDVRLSMPPTLDHVSPFLAARFQNYPRVGKENNEAFNVSAKITFYEQGSDKEMLTITGRWVESTQPSRLDPYGDHTDLPKTTFGVGEERTLDIAYLDPVANCCSAWNNDNYKYPGYSYSGHHLKGRAFRVRVRLLGPSVDSVFWFKFHLEEEKKFVASTAF